MVRKAGELPVVDQLTIERPNLSEIMLNGAPRYKPKKPKVPKRKTKRPGNVVNRFAQQNGKCYYCDCQMLLERSGPVIPPNYATRDHIIPRSLGGKGLHKNIILACQQCNSTRGSMPFEEFKEMMQLRRVNQDNSYEYPAD